MTLDLDERVLLKGMVGLLSVGLIWMIGTVTNNAKDIELLNQRLAAIEHQRTLQWEKLDSYQESLWKHQVELSILNEKLKEKPSGRLE